jgi:hypothetical protein
MSVKRRRSLDAFHYGGDARRSVRGRRKLFCGLVAIVAAIILRSAVVDAEPGDDATTAYTLFQEGKALAGKGDYAAACDRFERSLALDVLALGTALNLADCYEKRGMTARAFHLFDHVAAKAREVGDESKAKFGRDRADLLVPKLVRVDLRVPDLPVGTVVELNGEAVIVAPVIHELADAGPIVIAATAPDRQPFRVDVRGAAGDTVSVELVWPTARGPEIDPPRTEHPLRRRRSWVVAGLVAGSTGVVSLGVGLGFGYAAKQDHDQVLDNGGCRTTPAGLACTPAGASQESHAGNLADVATALTVAGAVVAATGIAMLVFAPRDRERAVAVAPILGVGQIGVAVGGVF